MNIDTVNQEGGFTLVELLVITATLSILTMLSVHSYGIYKAKAFDSQTQHSFHNIRAAVQAGLIERDFMEDFGFVWVDLGTKGQPSTADGRDLLPGYFNPANMDMDVWYDAWCANGTFGNWCTELQISGRHCSGGTQFLHQSMHNGADVNLTWQVAPGGC